MLGVQVPPGLPIKMLGDRFGKDSEILERNVGGTPQDDLAHQGRTDGFNYRNGGGFPDRRDIHRDRRSDPAVCDHENL